MSTNEETPTEPKTEQEQWLEDVMSLAKREVADIAWQWRRRHVRMRDHVKAYTTAFTSALSDHIDALVDPISGEYFRKALPLFLEPFGKGRTEESKEALLALIALLQKGDYIVKEGMGQRTPAPGERLLGILETLAILIQSEPTHVLPVSDGSAISRTSWPTTEPKCTGVGIQAGNLMLMLGDGQLFEVPLEQLPPLWRDADPRALAVISILDECGRGCELHWPLLRATMSVSGLLSDFANSAS